jgi:hypothetical protein
MIDTAMRQGYHTYMTGLVEAGYTVPDPPFAMGLFDLADPVNLDQYDFIDRSIVLSVMAERCLRTWGEGDLAARLADERHQGLSPLDILHLLAGEIMVSGSTNLGLIHQRSKWIGALNLSGGLPFTISAGAYGTWSLAMVAYCTDPPPYKNMGPVHAEGAASLAAALFGNGLRLNAVIDTHQVLSRHTVLDSSLGPHLYKPMT